MLQTELEPIETDIASDSRLYRVLGVNITDMTRRRAVELLTRAMEEPRDRTRIACFVNAHTLNLAASIPSFRATLDAFDFVFGDGTGVRWAARLQGMYLRENLAGTDLVPMLLHANAGGGYRAFLLGGNEALIDQAATHFGKSFPGWTLAGRHHGYLADPRIARQAIDHINAARPDLLLVGMGNPIQEQWLHANRSRLQVPLAIGVGGLFHYWAGDLKRAPAWLRRCGAEWLGILLQQPKKARRYLKGNPLFLARILSEACRNRSTAAV